MNLAKIKRNSIYNAFGWLVPIAIFLVLTPIMIEKLGVEAFGIVTLIQIITGYMTILNFGFSEAIIKQVAESLQRDKDHAMRVMWTGMGIFVVIGLIGALVLFMVADLLGTQVLLVPEDLRADTVTAIQIGSMVFLLQMMAEFYWGSAIGYGRFDVPSISRIVRIAISALLIIYMLEEGGGVAAVMFATLIGLVISLILNVVWMQRVLPMRWIGGDYRHIFMGGYFTSVNTSFSFASLV